MAVWRKKVPASGRAELEWVGVQGREEWEAHQRIEDPFMTFAFTEWTQCYWGNLAGVFQTSDSCHPLCILCICQPIALQSCELEILNTSSVSLSPPLQTSNLLRGPVYSIFLFIQSQMFAEPRCGPGLGERPGDSAEGGPARPLLPSPWLTLCYSDLSPIWTSQPKPWSGLASSLGIS